MIAGNRLRRALRRALRCAGVALLLAAALAPAVYFGVPGIARTAWARARIERSLARAAGAPVTVGKSEFSWRKGLTLRDVALARAAWGALEAQARVPEIRLRLNRRGIRAELFAPELAFRPLPEEDPAPRVRPRSFRVDRIDVRGGNLSYRDPGSAGALRAEDVSGRLSLARKSGVVRLEIQRVSALVNGGRVTGTCGLRAGPSARSLRLDLAGADLAANDLLARLARAAAPVLDGRDREGRYGSLSFRLQGSGSGRDLAELLASAQARGELQLRDAEVRTDGIAASRALRALEGRFALLDGRLLNPGLEACFDGDERWLLMGWTGADGTLDYAVRPSSGAAFRLVGTLDAPRLE